MENKFKVGDRVICIDNFDDIFTVGEVFTVTDAYTREYEDQEFAYICVKNDAGERMGGWYEYRFELYEEPIPTMTAVDIIKKEDELRRDADKAYRQVQLLNANFHLPKTFDSIADAIMDYHTKMVAWLEFRNTIFQQTQK